MTLSEQPNSVLEERARLLARPMRGESQEDGRPFLVFEVAGERYAVDLDHVSAVNRAAPVAHVPGLPAFWAGIVSFRGLLYPVLDLGRLLGLDASEREVAVFVVLSGRSQTAIPCEETPSVRRLGTEATRPALPGSRTDLISGVTGDLVSILDVDALMEGVRTTWDGDVPGGEG